VSFEDFIQKSIKGLLGLGFKDFWAYYPTTLLSSVADLAILPLQDILDLDDRARMNDPSVNAGNWRWRYESSQMLTSQIRDRLLEMTQLYSR
jgi:4-alpha-glucanotransferase